MALEPANFDAPLLLRSSSHLGSSVAVPDSVHFRLVLSPRSLAYVEASSSMPGMPCMGFAPSASDFANLRASIVVRSLAHPGTPSAVTDPTALGSFSTSRNSGYTSFSSSVFGLA